MAGGNRAYTLQDVLGQLNQDSAQGQTDNGASLQINQLTGVYDTVKAADAVTLTEGTASFDWNASAPWGSVQWGPVWLDGGAASALFGGADFDGGNASSTYPTTGNFDGGNAGSFTQYNPSLLADGGVASSAYVSVNYDGGAASSTYTSTNLDGGTS